MATSGPVTATRCSFCGKPAERVAKLVAGPGVYICDECIRLCSEIVAQSQTKREAPLDWTGTLDDDQLLHHLGNVARAGAQVEGNLRFVVETLRRRGVTWARIGEALGMTRQSAWERFSGEE